MNINLETLLIALGFILPGFFASKLISARTPSRNEEASVFTETAESLLRSLVINLVALPLAFLIASKYFYSSADFQQINEIGLIATLTSKPLQTELFVLTEFVLSLIVSFIFGFWWDPLDASAKRLLKSSGRANEDPINSLVQLTSHLRNQGKKGSQLWVQARLKNGYTYQGQLAQAGFPGDDNNRELLLSQVRFLPYSVDAAKPSELPIVSYDNVWINTANLDSIDFKFTIKED